MTRAPGRLCLISLGGNAILRRGDRGTVEEQFARARSCASHVARLFREDRGVVITHGNGPIVGNIVLRNEAARNTVPPMPLYICDADSEGGIGFMLQQTLYNQLHRLHQVRDVATIITQVVVSPDDPAFERPTKPIGPYYSEAQAEELRRTRSWHMVEDSGRGYRRVVPSPKPLRIVELEVIRRLADEGVVVVAAGGGGVPVFEQPNGDLAGAEAVIDKDLTTGVLARELGAQSIVNLTEVDRVYLDFGTPTERGLGNVTLVEIRRHLAEGQFPPGSMGPKIEGAVTFLEGGGREVLITQPELLEEALEGRAGTCIYP